MPQLWEHVLEPNERLRGRGHGTLMAAVVASRWEVTP
jgi:hypothetical protein